MFHVNRTNDSIVFEFSSLVELVFKAIKECQDYLEGCNAYSELIELKVILRELLLNAVKHGNKSDRESLVRCSIVHQGDKRFKIVVEDEGEGFDHKNIAVCTQTSQDPAERSGFLLIKRLSEGIEFNEKGNRITVYHKGKDLNKC